MALQELQIYGLWAGKQTAKGSAPAVLGRRFKHVANAGMGLARADGEENYSDATQFPDAQDWIDSIQGNATPGVQATPDELAWLFWTMEGGETTAAVVGPPAKTKHTAIPLPGLGHWHGWGTRKGSSVLQRHRHLDCQISQLEVGGSTGSKAIRATPTVLCLDPMEVVAADPVAALPTKACLLYTDGTSRFTIDGTVFRGQSEFTLTINKDLAAQQADDVKMFDLSIGNAAVTVGVTLFFDADGLAQWNKVVYGTSNPAAGAKPQTIPGALGAYAFDLRARDNTGAVNGDKAVLALAGVRWAVPDAPEPNPDGGPAAITLQGKCRKVGASPMYQMDIDCDAAAFTA